MDTRRTLTIWLVYLDNIELRKCGGVGDVRNRTSMATKPELRKIPLVANALGSLGILESVDLIPFPIKRVYFIYDVPFGEARGSHAHKTLEQFIVSLSGSFSVKLDSGKSTETFKLESPEFGLYVPQGYWRDLIGFSEHSVCLVLASTTYDEADYIRNYDEFLIWSGLNQ